MERQLLLLTRHFNAVAYRGLNRTSALKARAADLREQPR